MQKKMSEMLYSSPEIFNLQNLIYTRYEDKVNQIIFQSRNI